MSCLRTALVAAVCCLALLPSREARAATRTVCSSGCDYATIGAGIAGAAPGDVLELGAETFVAANITITKNLTLVGQGATRTFVQAMTGPGSGLGAVFIVPAGTVATFQDMTMRYANDSSNNGAGITNSGIVTGIDLIIERNYSAGVYSPGPLTLRRCIVRNNGGYGIYANGSGSTTIEDTTVSGTTGPGIYLANGTITRSTISGNVGTGLYVPSMASRVTVLNTTFTGNGSSAAYGGAIYNAGTLRATTAPYTATSPSRAAPGSTAAAPSTRRSSATPSSPPTPWLVYPATAGGPWTPMATR